MAHYVDGFVIPIPKDKVDAYRQMAEKGANIWREYGALDYKECLGDDLNVEMGMPFPKGLNIGPDETVIFSWIVYESREHRDEINAKVMADPRIKELCGDPESAPFDCKRMLYGGFTVLVE
jgi:uncharacterized protein YbaA (DUF1428 family)